MRRRLLITGGAGFVGTHLVNALVERGDEVNVLDNLDPQVHGPDRRLPGCLHRGARFILGDIRDRKTLLDALVSCDVLVHLAARVGVAQSMYEVDRYVDVNIGGTGRLLDLIISERLPIEKLIVASSMSVYGEGAYHCPQCGLVVVEQRAEAELLRQRWEPVCPTCAATLVPKPTDEAKPPSPSNSYALSKLTQERLCLMIGAAHHIPVVALRFFNIYGPHQALSNPYTGVAAIFCSRLSHSRPPLIFEDGEQKRDFVHVSDIVAGCLLAIDSETANGMALNLGSGRAITIRHLAEILAQHINPDICPRILPEHRTGDIRHCYASIDTARKVLGYSPRVGLEEGIGDLVRWVTRQESDDHLDDHLTDLRKKDLLR